MKHSALRLLKVNIQHGITFESLQTPFARILKLYVRLIQRNNSCTHNSPVPMWTLKRKMLYNVFYHLFKDLQEMYKANYSMHNCRYQPDINDHFICKANIFKKYKFSNQICHVTSSRTINNFKNCKRCFELPTGIHVLNKSSAHSWNPAFHYHLHVG
jgi:hypothetical protein